MNKPDEYRAYMIYQTLLNRLENTLPPGLFDGVYPIKAQVGTATGHIIFVKPHGLVLKTAFDGILYRIKEEEEHGEERRQEAACEEDGAHPEEG